MKSGLLDSLKRLRPLGDSSAAHGASRCKICSEPAFLFDIVDFNKVCAEEYYPFGFAGISVPYYRCQNCLFIFTDFFDDWTTADFAGYVYNSEYILVDGEYAVARPERMAEHMAGILAEHRAARILDFGSGTGVFAKRLSALGFAAVEDYDPFSSPKRPVGQFDIVTCFETIEHSPFPNETIGELKGFMKPSGCILFTTSLQPDNIRELRASWWYIAPRNGHVSIYTSAALEALAASVGLEFHITSGLFAFAGPEPAPQLARLLGVAEPGPAAAQSPTSTDRAMLFSPGEEPLATRGADWHEVEHHGATRFRWSQVSRIEWALRKPMSFPCRLTVTVPIVMEVVPGFAERCLIEVGRRSYPMHRESGAITVTIDLDHPPDGPVALITPEPQRPSDLRGAPDQRMLGLAVPLAES